METIILTALLAIAFLPFIVMVWKDDPNAFIKAHYPNAKVKDLPKTFLDIDRKR